MSVQVLFMNTGRTGYIVYFILMSLLLLQKLSFKKATLGIIVFSGLIILVYDFSPVMNVRVHDLFNDVKLWQHNNPNTSLGFRLQFHQYAQSLWVKHPVIGIGTGGFKYTFSQDKPIPAWGDELNDPHSQYWMTLAEQGIIGLALLSLFLASLLLSSFKLCETRPILLGILIIFSIGSFSDTIFCYSTAGYLLILMSALCCGELIEKHAFKTSKTLYLSSNEPVGANDDSIKTVHA